MTDNNADAKSLLLDSQLIVSNKFTVFSSDDSVDKTKLTKLQKKIDEEIEKFKKPEVWLQPLALDRTKVFSCLLAINGVNVPKIDDLTTHVEELISILNEALDTTAEAEENESSASNSEPNRNQEALAALQSIRRKILGRTQFFMARDIDLANDPTYKELRARQVPLRETYTEKLRDESIAANEIHVIFLNGFASAIQASEALEPFFKHYGELSDFIEQRLEPTKA